MRRDLAQRLGFAPDAFDGRMDEIKELMLEVVAELQDGEDGAFKTPLEFLLADGEVGRGAGPQWVYLKTKIMWPILHTTAKAQEPVWSSIGSVVPTISPPVCPPQQFTRAPPC